MIIILHYHKNLVSTTELQASGTSTTPSSQYHTLKPIIISTPLQISNHPFEVDF